MPTINDWDEALRGQAEQWHRLQFPMELLMNINRNAILARLEVVADCLDVPEQDWRAIANDDERLINFADEHGQSLDWLVLGDVRNYIRMAAERH